MMNVLKKHALRRARVRITGLVLACLVAPAVLAAQRARTPSRPRLSASGPGTATANVCAELASSPSSLVQVPEGLALLRLKRELESATQMIERKQPMAREQVKQLSQVQRGVDSAMQVIVRFYGHDGRDGATREVITIRRDDTAKVIAIDRVPDLRAIFVAVDSGMRGLVPMVAGDMVRALYPQVAAFAEAAESQLEGRVASPSGYVGVSLSGAQIRIVRPEGVMTSHCDYPMVESVDAGSPAERAGIVAGDTLIAYNGRDVTRQAINYPAMLMPGSTVRMRVRKSGRARELSVAVTARKDDRTLVEMRGNARGLPPEATFNTRVMVSGAASPAPPAPPSAPTNLMLSGTGIAVLAGAQFSTIDEEFAASLNLDVGVLVLRVPLGTPAADAGLRAGDVVLSANGVRVRDVSSLRRVLSGSAREVRLVVQSRNAGERVVILK
jgi:serine protease Do